MKILFIHPDFSPHPYSGVGEWGNYHEGIASISSVLKKAGHEVGLFHIKTPISKDRLTQHAASEHPHIIAFSVRTTNFRLIARYAAWLKERIPALIICGGCHPTLVPDQVISIPAIDVVCIGEGEYPLLELANALEGGASYENIDNLWVKTRNHVIKNPVRPLPDNLDALPLPDFDLFDFASLTSSRIFTACAMLTRGCVYNCSYCSNAAQRRLSPNPEKYFRKRSPQNSIEYLKKLKEACGKLKYIAFMDNDLCLSKKWFFEFIELYKKEINLPFSSNANPLSIDDEVIHALKEAGCYRIHIGVEHGNERFRYNILKRNISNERIIEVFRRLHDAGIATLAYNMINFPLETPLLTIETIKFNALLKPARLISAVYRSYPGTESYEMVLRDRLETYPTDDSQTLMVKNPHYRKAQTDFFSLYFSILVIVYQFIGRLPDRIKNICEKIIDKLLAIPYLPFELFNGIMRIVWAIGYTLKYSLRNNIPSLYIKLRDLLLLRRNVADAGHLRDYLRKAR